MYSANNTQLANVLQIDWNSGLSEPQPTLNRVSQRKMKISLGVYDDKTNTTSGRQISVALSFPYVNESLPVSYKFFLKTF